MSDIVFNDTKTCVENSSTDDFSRDTINKLGNRVQLTDKDETQGLELFCYVKCGPDDDEIVHQCRGVVFHKNEIIMRAFPYTVEYEHTELEKIKESIQPVFDNCLFFDSHEGVLIRMFNFSGKWFISTHRKLNAYRSKWSSKDSFGTCFEKALESELENNKEFKKFIPEGTENIITRFQNVLDPTKQYMFLVRHNKENRIVSDAPERPTVYHVGTFVDGKLTIDENIYIPYPVQHKFNSIDDLVEYVDNVDINYLQGIIAFAPNNKQYKIVHKNYQDFFKVRGNQPSVKYRYLQVRMDRQMLNMLYTLYPEMAPSFEKYENTLYAVAKNILKSYITRYINKIYVDPPLPQEEFKIIRECHDWHVQDRKQNRISLEKVIEVMNKQDPTLLNQLIRAYHQNELLGFPKVQEKPILRKRSHSLLLANKTNNQ